VQAVTCRDPTDGWLSSLKDLAPETLYKVGARGWGTPKICTWGPSGMMGLPVLLPCFCVCAFWTRFRTLRFFFRRLVVFASSALSSKKEKKKKHIIIIITSSSDKK
jgi:hypothetical protein